jgi:hypothetical protein
MNRYWLFQECDYEACGGLEDLKGTFHTVLKAKRAAEQHRRQWDLSYIIDSKTWKTTWNKDYDGPWKRVKAESYDIGEPKEKTA